MSKIVVTGASSEIGAAICRRIVRPEDELVIQCHKNIESLNRLKNEIVCKNTVSFSGDLSNQEFRSEFAAALHDCDILVNCAASTISSPLAQMNDNEIEQMIGVNIIAMVQFSRAAIPGMIARRKGCILNVSSVTASRGMRGQTVYAGTKGFIESFTRSLATECGKKGVRVNCIAPGPVDAGSLKDLLQYAGDEVKKNIALNRLGTPDEIARVAAFLLSEDASFITGEVVQINGGFMHGL